MHIRPLLIAVFLMRRVDVSGMTYTEKTNVFLQSEKAVHQYQDDTMFIRKAFNRNFSSKTLGFSRSGFLEPRYNNYQGRETTRGRLQNGKCQNTFHRWTVFLKSSKFSNRIKSERVYSAEAAKSAVHGLKAHLFGKHRFAISYKQHSWRRMPR